MKNNKLFKFLLNEYKNHKYVTSYSNVLKSYSANKRFSLKSIFILHFRLIEFLLVPKTKYKKGQIIFVSLTRNYEKYLSKVNYKYSKIVSDRSNLKNIFSRFSGFLIIYFLINYPKIWFFGTKLRKFFIRKIISEINFLCSNKPTFIVRADICGSDSTLASLNNSFKNINLINIQHGLFSYSDFPKYPFPGLRCTNFILNHKIYLPMYLTHVPNYQYLISSPPPLNLINSNLKKNKKALVFVSGKNLEHKIYIDFCLKLKNIAHLLNIPFFVCPHPKDVLDLKYLIENNINFKFNENIDFDRFNPNKTLFIGIHTTFLYEIASSGFKTVWIKPNSCCPVEDQQRELLLPDIKNGFFVNIEKISLKKIKSFLDKSLEHNYDPCIFSNPETLKYFEKNCQNAKLNEL